MKTFKIYNDNKLIVRIKNKNILNEKEIISLRENKILISCYNKEHNILFYEEGKIVKDLIDNIFVEFEFNDIEDIYRSLSYECFICVMKDKILKIKILNEKTNKFNIEFFNEV